MPKINYQLLKNLPKYNPNLIVRSMVQMIHHWSDDFQPLQTQQSHYYSWNCNQIVSIIETMTIETMTEQFWLLKLCVMIKRFQLSKQWQMNPFSVTKHQRNKLSEKKSFHIHLDKQNHYVWMDVDMTTNTK